ncbi:5-oxopent-3-ene-1,2,5-tricarboxylate decarboxylase [Cupriavidus necator]|uniref:5-oxopent-3-ene-1,2,5-tricarboxylate decarboxylase n=1 Tax=Cupriavidus necator TaxID=106590 RepID=A0A1U9V0P1_CUPNE|nr:fumarylacetoacetate hydrolase family protein [Cupriavidus necator]AQV98217.1 5-oxopent-3-ene-1,2,5-tricarboxylate decarboxylase [Cupriavidus necator]
MKLVTILLEGTQRVGVLTDRGIAVLPQTYGADAGALIQAGLSVAQIEQLLGQATVVPDDDTIQYLPPVGRPPKIICVGLNYADHTKESPYEQPDYPTLFFRVATSLVGHGGPIVRPLASDTLDFEGELAVVLGKGGKHIARDSALEHVFGYSVFNDGSVREYQFKSPQWTVGKNFDSTGAFGPVLVTADELPPGAAGLLLQTRLNGQIVQSASTSDMLYDVASLIAITSEAITLEPGDVIVAGTPSGIGWARNPKLIMRDGDVCEVSIEGIGTLRNRVEDEVRA